MIDKRSDLTFCLFYHDFFENPLFNANFETSSGGGTNWHHEKLGGPVRNPVCPVF